MQLTVQLPRLPIRLRFEQPLTDEKLELFCAENSLLRIEREENGELTLMSPNTSDGSAMEMALATEFAIWARQDGRGKVFGPTGASPCPTALCVRPIFPGFRLVAGTH